MKCTVSMRAKVFVKIEIRTVVSMISSVPLTIGGDELVRSSVFERAAKVTMRIGPLKLSQDQPWRIICPLTGTYKHWVKTFRLAKC
jgi:hypothetical protein